VDSDAVLETAPSGSGADERVMRAEAERRRERIRDALRRAREQLEPEDQVIVRMRFEDGYTLADVARLLRLEQKPLYRRLDRVLVRLREMLEAEGLGRDDVVELLDDGEAP